MALRKCCVVDCNSTSRTHRLFNLPRDDKLRELWLSFLIPMNPLLSGLSKEQLIQKRVCQKHFDRHQFDSIGNRLQHGYPCLFSVKEILHGTCLSSFDNHMSDHNYAASTSSATVPQKEGNTITEEPMEVDLTGDHIYAASTCTATVPQKEGDTSTEQPMEVDLTESIVAANIMDARLKLKKRTFPRNKVKNRERPKIMKCYCSIKKMKELNSSGNKKELSFDERYTNAKGLSQDAEFISLIRNINKLKKPAQNFLHMQLKLAGKKKKAMRFTTNEKLLSLTLMKESPKGYRLLQKMFTLPSKRTLNRLAEKISFNPGLNENIFLLLEKKAAKWDIKKKLCSIVFDEVALTPNLTFDEHKDEVKGFKNLGHNIREPKFSDHALVFMVRGVCSNWRQPIAYYFCEGTISSPELIKILKEIVSKIYLTGLIPLALICDQGSTFRTAINILRKDTERQRILDDQHNDGSVEICGHPLSVIYDPPHLLKGIRNNFLTKNMLFNGKLASWDDIITVYNTDCQLGHTRMHNKLTDQHVVPHKIKKMKVNLAAQVFSQKTSAMLKYTSMFEKLKSGDIVSNTMAVTGEAIEFFDTLFDSANGSKNGSTKGKLRGAVKPTSKHFSFWQEAKKILKNIKFVDTNSKRSIAANKHYQVRVPSLDSWIVTIESFERISKLLFSTYEVQYFYTRNLNQDPLENFFGRIRALNYRNVNPDSRTFINSFKSLLITNVMGPHSIYSNCEDDEGETIIDFLNLLKFAPQENKENINPLCSNYPSCSKVINEEHSISLQKVIIEKIKVHASAYTAGYMCRKMTHKFNCKNCLKTYIADNEENYHEWIVSREYKNLKNRNLTYCSKQILILYRRISEFIHNYMNSYAHQNNISKILRNLILNKFDLDWLGCQIHKKALIEFIVKLLIRVQVHNWCNTVNKILRGALDEKYVGKDVLQQKALQKYKANKLRKKKINN